MMDTRRIVTSARESPLKWVLLGIGIVLVVLIIGYALSSRDGGQASGTGASERSVATSPASPTRPAPETTGGGSRR
jgi:hypothetical protein